MKTATRSRTSQNELILRRLMRANGKLVSLPALVKCSGSYAIATRVSNINKALEGSGCYIENEQRTAKDGTRQSFYRYVG